MRPVEKLYRNFCEHIAGVCDTEAKVYEEHPSLHDADFQFISSLRAKSDEWRRQLQRMEGAYPDGKVWSSLTGMLQPRADVRSRPFPFSTVCPSRPLKPVARSPEIAPAVIQPHRCLESG